MLQSHRRQKQILYLLELDLPLTVSHHVLSFVTTAVLPDARRKNGEHGELSPVDSFEGRGIGYTSLSSTQPCA